jgi:hypothetical protein
MISQKHVNSIVKEQKSPATSTQGIIPYADMTGP